jgi:hypothetical protein
MEEEEKDTNKAGILRLNATLRRVRATIATTSGKAMNITYCVCVCVCVCE